MPSLTSRSFPAALFVSRGQSANALVGKCTELVPAGMYISYDGPLPGLKARVRVRLGLPEGDVECDGEVVRLITPRDAAAWQMPVGCAVQFVDPPPALKAAVVRATSLPGQTSPGDAEVRLLLSAARSNEDDHYTLLGIAHDAKLSEAWERANECMFILERALVSNPHLDRAVVHHAIDRFKRAGVVLGDAALRAEYDGGLSNFRGVAVCIAAGLTVAQLESMRNRHLAVKPMAALNAMARVTAARLKETAGRHKEAVENLEQALRHDPLNLKLHLAWSRAVRIHRK